MSQSLSQKSAQAALRLAAIATAAALAGCAGMTTTATSGPLVGATLAGTIHGGQQPVTGSHVYLYATGSNGYGGASGSLLGNGSSTAGLMMDGSGNYYTTSGAGGQFTIAANFSCPTSTSQIYLLAVGGNPGLAAGTNNSAITLIAGVGSCTNITAASNIIINEVSTAAAVTALQQFMTDTTHIGAASTNLTGVQTAFTAITNIFDVGGTTARATPLSGNGSSPQAKLNDLGNILAPCVNSTGPASTPCAALFAAAKPSGGTMVTDVARAMLQIAQNPTANPGGLFALIDTNAPFPATLTSAPNDFTLPITFKAAGLAAPGDIVIDISGNAWVANCPSCSGAAGTDSLIGLTPNGTVISTLTTGIHKPQGIALDVIGNLWSVNQAGNSLPDQIVKESTFGVIATGFPFANSSLATPIGIALDANSNAWVSNEGGSNIDQVGSNGTLLHNVSSPSLQTPVGIGIDGTGNIFTSAAAASDIYKTNGSTLASVAYTSGGLANPIGIAIDNSDNIWTINNQSNLVTIINGTTGTPVSSGSGYAEALTQAAVIAIDGAGTAWVANCRAGCPGSGSVHPDDIIHFNSAGTLLNTQDGFEDSNLSTAGTAAIDASGNLWVTNNTGNSVTEFLGVAAPVKTPLAAASASNSLGVRP